MIEPSISVKENFSFKGYLELEEREDLRHEFLDGLVITKLGESFTHHDICQNTSQALKKGLDRNIYHSYIFSIKTEAIKSQYYFYPDVVLTCSKDDLTDGYIIKNPLLIIEVLSPSTENYDRGTKSIKYRRLPSLRYYLLISQMEPLVQVYSRNSSTALFQVQDFSSMEDIIHFPDLNFSLSLQQIYNRINFETTRSENDFHSS